MSYSGGRRNAAPVTVFSFLGLCPLGMQGNRLRTHKHGERPLSHRLTPVPAPLKGEPRPRPTHELQSCCRTMNGDITGTTFMVFLTLHAGNLDTMKGVLTGVVHIVENLFFMREPWSRQALLCHCTIHNSNSNTRDDRTAWLLLCYFNRYLVIVLFDPLARSRSP